MSRRKPTINATQIGRYLNSLKEQERSAATLSKYAHDLAVFCTYLQDAPLTKAALIDWKQTLAAQYAPATVNSMLAVVNGYLRFMGWATLCVKPIKVQRSLFLDERKELTKAEYAGDYDFSALEQKSHSLMQRFGFLEVAIRQNDLSCEGRDYLKTHPHAAVVNLGCGLDSTERNCDNGKCRL